VTVHLRFVTGHLRLVTAGRLLPHDECRHDLIRLENLEDVTAFHTVARSVFFSHQWLGVSAPDPSNVHYEAMVSSLRIIAEEEGLDPAELFVWVDYSSVPQRNPHMQRLAILSLCSYASWTSKFVVIAPQSTHADLQCRVDASSYARRGWCRLEQWAFIASMSPQAASEMLIYTEAGLQRRELTQEWFEDACQVFGGEFTKDEDKEALVDPLLGLWVNALRSARLARKNDLKSRATAASPKLDGGASVDASAVEAEASAVEVEASAVEVEASASDEDTLSTHRNTKQSCSQLADRMAAFLADTGHLNCTLRTGDRTLKIRNGTLKTSKRRRPSSPIRGTTPSASSCSARSRSFLASTSAGWSRWRRAWWDRRARTR